MFENIKKLFKKENKIDKEEENNYIDSINCIINDNDKELFNVKEKYEDAKGKLQKLDFDLESLKKKIILKFRNLCKDSTLHKWNNNQFGFIFYENMDYDSIYFDEDKENYITYFIVYIKNIKNYPYRIKLLNRKKYNYLLYYKWIYSAPHIYEINWELIDLIREYYEEVKEQIKNRTKIVTNENKYQLDKKQSFYNMVLKKVEEW